VETPLFLATSDIVLMITRQELVNRLRNRLTL
jgi:hypothetical protein